MNTKTFSSIANTPISDNWGSDPSYTQAKKVGVQSRHGCKYSQVACNKITGIRVIAPPRYRPGTLNAQLLAKEDRLKDHHCPDKGPFLTFSHDVVFVCVCIHRVFSSFRFRTLRVLGHPVGLVGNWGSDLQKLGQIEGNNRHGCKRTSCMWKRRLYHKPSGFAMPRYGSDCLHAPNNKHQPKIANHHCLKMSTSPEEPVWTILTRKIQ